ncbi:MAG: sigma-54-dependent Fis family transcriptional regulator [Candidatus Omnitrophota bacterium]|jgi:DNA-binding NtrC family response regulator|nr:MAG: sigma-54-dependent Fis family transcriptional regulator [Candidatus Omnitrophota bacterium]
MDSCQSDISLRVLVVDDEPDMVTTLHDLLIGEGNHVDTAYNSAEALTLLEKKDFDLILTDLSMSGMNGVDLLKEVKTGHPDTEIMIITGYGTISSAVEAMRHGALNYLIKPVEPQEIILNVDRVKRRFALRGFDYKEHRFHNLIGKSPAMRKIFTLIPRVARMHGSVLIQGESGVGKELVAQAIHLSSTRKSKRFVPIDCGALSDTLLESELFGHKHGAFTGSTSDRIGMIETAHGGTLLLDEVGNASSYLQSRLLRVIEEKKVRRLGENTMIPVDVRILAASNAPLHDLVDDGSFREDLFYRLSGFVINIPPLRERIEDVPLLSRFFLELNAQYYEQLPSEFSPQAMEILMQYSWPGNVRELRTVVDRAIALAEGDTIEHMDITFNGSLMDDLPFEMPALSDANESVLSTPFYTAVETFEKNYLSLLLERAEGNISKASQLSGASRKTIREKGKKYGLL